MARWFSKMEPYNQIHGDRAIEHNPFLKTHDAYEFIKKSNNKLLNIVF